MFVNVSCRSSSLCRKHEGRQFPVSRRRRGVRELHDMRFGKKNIWLFIWARRLFLPFEIPQKEISSGSNRRVKSWNTTDFPPNIIIMGWSLPFDTQAEGTFHSVQWLFRYCVRGPPNICKMINNGWQLDLVIQERKAKTDSWNDAKKGTLGERNSGKTGKAQKCHGHCQE